MNRPIAATPAAPAPATSSQTASVMPPIASTGTPGRGNDRAQPVETEERLRRRLRSCREDGAGDQIVRAGRLIRIVNAVH